MSTNATILVRLRKEDVGRFKKCDLSSLPIKTKKEFRREILPDIEHVKEQTHKIKLVGNYIEIYHHWDSYAAGLGQVLLKDYNTYEKALNLCLIGDVSSILNGVVPYTGYNTDWKQNKPDFHNEIPDNYPNYQYVFEDGRWKYRCFHNRISTRFYNLCKKSK